MNCTFVKTVICVLVFLGFSYGLWAQHDAHPMMWVVPADRQKILDNIAATPWMRDYFKAFTTRVKPDMDAYKKDPTAYLKQMPLNWEKAVDGKIPDITPADDYAVEQKEKNNRVIHLIQTAIDCGVLYFLTEEVQYAQMAASILNLYFKSLVQVSPSTEVGNGGWLHQANHLREARELGAQIPIAYDFIYNYAKQGGKVYNPVSEQQEPFPFAEAQIVFKTYCELAVNHGIINCNWPVFESMSLLGNAMAMDDKELGKKYIGFVTETSTAHQDALPKINAFYKTHGGQWPESINYAQGTTSYITYVLTWLSRYGNKLIDGSAYADIPKALAGRYYLQYPNGEDNIIYGDGHRHFEIDFESYETAYAFGNVINDKGLKEEFGSLLRHGIEKEGYNRGALKDRSYGAEVYREPTHLLWSVPNIEGAAAALALPVTNSVPFAGIMVQRNLNTSDPIKNGMMSFVGGAGYVHGHASGMNMELYGIGHVLGNKGGRKAYGTDIHENYYRLFASHNTVVVNGSSRGEGGWVNNSINTVKHESVEPLPFATPVSPDHSFVSASFTDDGGDKAEATQLRTMGIVRTSATTGYYVDIFKSKSSLPNQYHDYIYHNIGESLDANAGKGFVLKDDESRYTDASPLPWVKNKSFRNPGWQFFEKVHTAENYADDVQVIFSANALQEKPVHMHMWLPGNAGRSYTTAMAPPSAEGPIDYTKKPTPTVVIRQNGEAWTNPFMVVFEASEGNKNSGSVKQVEQLRSNGVSKGLVVHSEVGGKKMRQIIVVQDNDDEVFEDAKMKLRFTGRYMVLTLNDNDAVSDIYIGSGKALLFDDWDIHQEKNAAFAANLRVSNAQAMLKASQKLVVKAPGIKIVNE